MLTFMGELKTIRNTTAHNRKNSDLDFQLFSSFAGAASNHLESQSIRDVSKKVYCLGFFKEFLSNLQREGARVAELCSRCKPIDSLPAWSSTRKYNSFDDDYIGSNIEEPVRRYFALVSGYMSLPRSRGSGHRIEESVGH